MATRPAVDELPALVLIALWSWYGRNSPREHAVGIGEELAEISGRHRHRRRLQHAAHGSADTESSISLRRLVHLVGNRSVFAAGGFLHVHELYVLFAFELGVPLSRAGAQISALGERMAGGRPASGGGDRRRHRRCCHRSLLQAFRRALGVSFGAPAAMPLAGGLLLLAVNATNPYLAVVPSPHASGASN